MTITAAELPGERINIGGHRLYLHCMGEGAPTVVIDAGMGGFSLEWQPVQERLAHQARVCSYDRAGYGYSDPGPLPRTSARIARELHTLLHTAGIPGPYLLVGHSFGGYNIRYFASAYPEETAGLVLVDASHPEQFERMAEHTEREAIMPEPGDNRLWLSRAIIPDNYPAHLVQRARVLMNTRKARATQIEELRYFKHSADEVLAAGLLPDVPIMVLTRGQRVWPYTVEGHRMEQVWAEMQRDLAALSPRSLHLIAANSGHSIHLDQPDAVSSAVFMTLMAAQADWRDWQQVAAHDPAAQSQAPAMLDDTLYLVNRRND